MLELPGILEAYRSASGHRWSYIARMLGVQPETIWHWRRGKSLPWPGKVEHLATLLNRPDLMHVVERDRMALRTQKASAPAQEHPTPRTLIMPATPADGAA